jgi:hypothetical protein
MMKDLDIGVTKEEIEAVLSDLDKDGNGEIDFDEFLYCMTEPGRFIQTLDSTCIVSLGLKLHTEPANTLVFFAFSRAYVHRVGQKKITTKFNV